MKQTHDKKVVENLSPITKKLDVTNDSTKQSSEIFKKSDVEDGESQTPAIGNVTISESLRDRLAIRK